MKCNDSPNVNNANFSTDNNIFGSIMEIICIDWYWIPELASNTVNTTCVMDQSGLFATWCWTPPCQGIDYKMILKMYAHLAKGIN
jgi:hypothetical protein